MTLAKPVHGAERRRPRVAGRERLERSRGVQVAAVHSAAEEHSRQRVQIERDAGSAH